MAYVEGMEAIGNAAVEIRVSELLGNVGLISGVRYIQRTLNAFGYGLRVDGRMGPLTFAAIKAEWIQATQPNRDGLTVEWLKPAVKREQR